MKKSFLHRAVDSVTRNLLSKRSLRQRPGLIEPLETRRMFDVVLPVFCTSGDDVVTIDMDSDWIYASMDGVMIPQPIGSYIGVEVHCGDGNDTIEVRNTRP